jgi:hypothetical protein
MGTAAGRTDGDLHAECVGRSKDPSAEVGVLLPGGTALKSPRLLSTEFSLAGGA